jgi:hypothetical protein
MTWQPIETAPRDGTHIMGYNGDERYELSNIKETWMGKAPEGSINYQKWMDGEIPRNTGWEYVERDCCFKWSPTHWMPLPAPPEVKP